MGGLHRGHQSLIERSCRDNARTLVSIFVNPLQFGPGEDLERYPRTTEADLALCAAAGVDGVFMPTPQVLYGADQPDPQGQPQIVPPVALTKGLCGPFRPGHFEGVALVVTKLLNLVCPDRAYFGQKDAQQIAIIQRLAADLHLPGAIIGCPTVRDEDGLALSSRNRYLNAADRAQARHLYQGLQAAEAAFHQGERQASALLQLVKQTLATAPDLELQYVALVDSHSLEPLAEVQSAGMVAVAATIHGTRLIDNVRLRTRRPIIAIDGPAGAGKSTVAGRVARQLGLLYLDSGAMYRAIAWLALERGIDPTDEVAVAELLATVTIELAPAAAGAPFPSRIWVDGQEVTEAIRTPAVTGQVSAVAAQGQVRRRLQRQQQQYGLNGGVVMDGRDIGTQVFPQAELKIFLTASVQERARRRQRDLLAQHQSPLPLAELEQAIAKRDRQDSTRALSPLRRAQDAVEISTDALSIEQVVAQIVTLFEQNQLKSGQLTSGQGDPHG